MSLNLNKVILAGRLTAAPELKQTPNGIFTTTFTVAVDRPYSKGEKKSDFIQVVAWRGTAKFVAKYFSKGSPICVCGSIQTRSWQDNNNQKHYATEVVADDVRFVESGKKEPEAPVATSEIEHSDDDELPF